MKDTKCGRSETFGTCLQQWFILGITENLMRQEKENKATPMTPASDISPEELRKVAINGRNDRDIAMIA